MLALTAELKCGVGASIVPGPTGGSAVSSHPAALKYVVRKKCSLPLVPLRIAWKFGDLKIHLEVVTRGHLAVQFEALAMSSLVYTLGSCGGCHEGCLDLGVLCRGLLGKACVDRVFRG